jgi:pimeloyl-ACP methyl ester carboxylesterase
VHARVASADGLAIAYEAHGGGVLALVFVHGWSCDRSYWAGQLQPLAQSYRVVAVDLAGHGDSGQDRRAWTIEAFGDDVAAVVRDLRLERAVLVGHSMGGDVVVEAALRLPGRVVAMVWVDVYRELDSPRTPEQIRTFAEPFRLDFAERTKAFVRTMFPPSADGKLVERVAGDMAAAPPAVAVPCLQSAQAFEYEIPQALRELGLPVIAINPDDGHTDMESLRRHGVRTILMPDVGHFPMLEAPQRFNELLARIVEEISGDQMEGAEPCA